MILPDPVICTTREQTYNPRFTIPKPAENERHMFNLLPKDTVFYDLFENLSRHVVSAAEHLRQLAKAYPDASSETHAHNIREVEHEADDLAHTALDRLDRTFITPFDREDIHTLVGELDDIVDTVDALAKRFKLYHVQEIEAAFIKQTDVLVQAASVLSDAVHRLRKSRKLSELSDRLIEIHRLENVGDDNNHAAVSKLFEGNDALYVMKWKELYDLIESAIDGCEDVGNTLERIVLKNG
jgi:predicted phosphate transport protein (TIGR00153 family)